MSEENIRRHVPVVVERQILINRRNARRLRLLRRQPRIAPPADGDDAAVRREVARKNFDEGALPAPVVADDGGDLARARGEADAAQRRDIAEALRYILRRQNGSAAVARAARRKILVSHKSPSPNRRFDKQYFTIGGPPKALCSAPKKKSSQILNRQVKRTKICSRYALLYDFGTNRAVQARRLRAEPRGIIFLDEKIEALREGGAGGKWRKSGTFTTRSAAARERP